MKTSIRIVFYILSIATLNGCGTIYTVSTDREMLTKEACSNECTIARIYSGTAFDICGLTEEDAGQGGAILFWDLLFSIPADTVVLPYTVYLQASEGSISNKTICSQERSPNKLIKRDQ